MYFMNGPWDGVTVGSIADRGGGGWGVEDVEVAAAAPLLALVHLGVDDAGVLGLGGDGGVAVLAAASRVVAAWHGQVAVILTLLALQRVDILDKIN